MRTDHGSSFTVAAGPSAATARSSSRITFFGAACVAERERHLLPLAHRSVLHGERLAVVFARELEADAPHGIERFAHDRRLLPRRHLVLEIDLHGIGERGARDEEQHGNDRFHGAVFYDMSALFGFLAITILAPAAR